MATPCEKKSHLFMLVLPSRIKKSASRLFLIRKRSGARCLIMRERYRRDKQTILIIHLQNRLALAQNKKTGFLKPDGLFASQHTVPVLFTIPSYHENRANGVHNWCILDALPYSVQCKFGAKRVQQSCFEEEFLIGFLIIRLAPLQQVFYMFE